MNEALEQLMMQKLLYNQALIDSVEIAKTDIMARVEEEVQDMIAREGIDSGRRGEDAQPDLQHP
ncbi:MAG: hypothetical protein ACLUNS_01280 [Alistipes shahii]